ncbi:hypothetical protein F4604DRAFT_1780097 [Suillus subluteus]|nr:hypothetical protein F4604DRAFT_1780097 [Suillus subluteus]
MLDIDEYYHMYVPSFFVLRTHVLWKKNRIILVAMLSTLSAVIVSSFIIGFTATVTSYSTGNAIPGCHRNSGSFSFFVPFILLFVFQLVLVSLTRVCVIQSWRSAEGPLYAILVKHNIFYYTCSLRESELTYVSMLIGDD